MSNMKVIKALINKLPDGPKKSALLSKFQKANAPKDGGIHDTFEFKPKGHIRIESIDAAGNSLGILADQANLVVKGAEEIMLRAFSGDPDRTLYKNRIPKSSTGVSKKFHIGLSGDISAAVAGVDQLNFAPNILWKAVDDSEFDISYSYRPKTVFLKEETSEQVGKKAFSISKTLVTGSIPLSSEIYSAQTNMFIGLGDGKNRAVELSDTRLVYAGGFAVADGKATADTVGATITLNEKISNFVIEYEKSAKGGQIEVRVNGVLKETIETYDSSLAVPVAASKEIKGLSADLATVVELKFSGSDPSVTAANIIVTGIRTDGLTKEMNGLFREFENFTKSFETVTSYSTTTAPPYAIQLNHFPVVPESLVVDYNGTIYQQVDSKNKIAENKFYLDDKTGILEFNRTLSGILITHEITGEHYELKAAAKLTAGTVIRTITDEVIAGADGTKVDFALAKSTVSAGTLVVKVNGAVVNNFTQTNGVIKFSTAPLDTDTITASYKSSSTTRVYSASTEMKTARVFVAETGEKLTLAATDNEFEKGKYKFDPADKKKLIISDRTAAGDTIVNVEIIYADEAPGFATNYQRAIIEKLKTGATYPWYQLDKGTVSFIAEFPEQVPAYNVTIREMGLFNGPRTDDKVEGFTGYPVDAFSLVRVGETRKEVTTGIRVTWTITLLNKDGDSFYGGF